MRWIAVVLLAVFLGAATPPPAAGPITPSTLPSAIVKAQGGPAARPLAAKLGDTLSLLDFGAVCDAVTDDSAAVTAATASGKRISIPAGLVCNAPSLSIATLPPLFTGPGQIKDSSGYANATAFGSVNAEPDAGAWNQSTGVGDGCTVNPLCFGKWNLSNVFDVEQYNINGASTLGVPTSGYEYMPGAIPHTVFFANNSGSNYLPTGNSGRTGAVWRRSIVRQNGGGDLLFEEYEAEANGGAAAATVAGNGSAYTSWLAVPNVTIQAGDIGVSGGHNYLQREEWHFSDNGLPAAVVGSVFGYNRASTMTTASDALNNRWVDRLAACNVTSGTVPCDGAYVVQGKWRIGLDFVEINSQIAAPILMQSGQKIALNGSWGDGEGNPGKANIGNDWITDDGNGVVIAQSGGTVLRLTNQGGETPVNYWQMSNSPAGGALYLAAQGVDPGIPLVVADKGGSGVLLQSNGTFGLKVSNGSTANTYLQVGQAASTSALVLQAQGPADLGLQPNGSGALVRLTGNVPAATDNSTAVPDTAVMQMAIKSSTTGMTGNPQQILNLGSGGTINVAVPSGAVDQMLVEIQPNAATIATLTLNLPSTASMPTRFVVHFVSSATITALTLAGASGQTVLGAPGTISAGGGFAMLWDGGLTPTVGGTGGTWMRFQ